MNQTRDSVNGDTGLVTYAREDDPRWPVLLEHGNRSSHYFTLQPNVMPHFCDGKGYLAFERFNRKATTLWGYFPETFVLADPVAPPLEKMGVIGDFLSIHKDACFVQVSEEVAKGLSALGYYINQFGVEVHIEMKDFSLTGNRRKTLRQNTNRAQTAKVSVLEVDDSEVNWDSVASISSSWKQRKRSQDELRFLTGPISGPGHPEIRKFFARCGQVIVGYVFFTPIFSRQQTIGYAANIIRVTPTAPDGTTDLMIVRALEQFREEGKEILSFGFSPFAAIEPVLGLNTRPNLTWLLRTLYERGNRLYSFKGLYFHKTRYNGWEEKVYFASKNGNSWWQLLQTFQLCNVF